MYELVLLRRPKMPSCPFRGQTKCNSGENNMYRNETGQYQVRYMSNVLPAGHRRTDRRQHNLSMNCDQTYEQ